jgi:sec-independent protein translocase protein TatA
MIGEIIQPTHLLLLLAVALVVLGPKRLPGAGNALGRSIRDFRAAVAGESALTPITGSDNDETQAKEE